MGSSSFVFHRPSRTLVSLSQQVLEDHNAYHLSLTLRDINDTIILTDHFYGYLLLEYPENRSVEIRPLEVHEALEADFELWYYGTTNITAFIRSKLNHVYRIWDTSIFYSGGSVASYDVFGPGLVAPQLLIPERELYGGEIVVRLRSSTGDILPCQRDNGYFRVRVKDVGTGLLLCNDSTVTWNHHQNRIILTYNYTRYSDSQVIEVLRDDKLLRSHTVILDMRQTPSFSL